MLHAMLFPRWDILGSDVSQLMAAWDKQMQDYERQSGDKISDAMKLGSVLHHLPDASLREHLLLNPRAHDTCIWTAASHGKNDVGWSIADGSECARER